MSSLQLYPFHIPDLSTGSPLIVSGRYHGNFPYSVKVGGNLADLSSFVVDVKVQKVKDFPLDRVISQVLKLILFQLIIYLINADYMTYFIYFF